MLLLKLRINIGYIIFSHLIISKTKQLVISFHNSFTYTNLILPSKFQPKISISHLISPPNKRNLKLFDHDFIKFVAS